MSYIEAGEDVEREAAFVQNWPCSLVFDLVTHHDLVKNDPMSVQRVQELCGSRGGHPGLPVPNKPDCFCGCKEH